MFTNTDAQAKALAFKESVEAKIRNLIEEFAEGRISRDQFHLIYERYSAQLSIATHAMVSGNPDAVAIVQGGPPTIAIREASTGKAIGLLIYHNRSATVLETLGELEVGQAQFQTILNDYTAKLNSGSRADRRVERFGDKQVLMFNAGKFTTVVTQFSNAPSEMQNREIARLHLDYERANASALNAAKVEGQSLACPFLIFVRQKVKRA